MERKKGFHNRNCSGDYRLWWTCGKAVKKIIASPLYDDYPEYLQEYLRERAKTTPDNSYYNIIGLTRGIELLPSNNGKETAGFIKKKKLVAVAVKREDWDKIKVPPGFITDLNYELITKIPK